MLFACESSPGIGLHLLLYKAAGVCVAQPSLRTHPAKRMGFVFSPNSYCASSVLASGFGPADQISYQEEP